MRWPCCVTVSVLTLAVYFFTLLFFTQTKPCNYSGRGGAASGANAGSGGGRVGRRKAHKTANSTPNRAVNPAVPAEHAIKPEGANVETKAVAATNVRRKCRKDSDGNCIKRKADRSRSRNTRRKKNSKRRQDVSSSAASSAPASQAGASPSAVAAAAGV